MARRLAVVATASLLHAANAALVVVPLMDAPRGPIVGSFGGDGVVFVPIGA